MKRSREPHFAVSACISNHVNFVTPSHTFGNSYRYLDLD